MKIPLLKNTATNYLSMFVRFVQGILVTRWLISNLGTEYYGLWAMLWSFFCYSLLLDFGLGVAAQKSTSTELWRQDIDKYNRTVSTVFSFHLVMSVLIILGTLFGACFIRLLLKLPDGADPSYYRYCFLCFGIGSALVFPFGMFPEILVGLQKLYLRNYVTIVSKLLELAGILVIFSLGGGLITLILFTLILTALTQWSMMIMTWRLIPGFRLSLKPDRNIFREIYRFSSSIYLIALARMVWGRGIIMLITIFCGLSATAIYQLGGRLPMLMSQLTGPYQENIAPVTALLHSRRKQHKLAIILLNTMRWNSFLATGMTVGIMIYAGVLIRFLFKVDFPEATLICRVMAISIYVGLIFRTIPDKYLLMADNHKFLSKIILGESAFLVASSMALMPFFKEAAVVYCSLAAKLIFTGGFILPRMIRCTGINVVHLFRDTVLRQMLATLPMAAAAVLEYRYLEGKINDFFLLVIAGTTGAVLYAAFSYFLVINRRERSKLPVISKFLKQKNLPGR